MYYQKSNCVVSAPSSTFIYLWAIYIFIPRSIYSIYFAAAKKADQSWEYINRQWYMYVETGTEDAQFPFWEYFSYFQYSTIAV